MQFRTHISTSLCMGIGVVAITNVEPTLGFLSGVVIGSLMPDLDEPKSYLGRRSLGISFILNKMFGHRGFTHSLSASFLLFILYFIFSNDFVLGMSFGYLFHIIGDFFSKSGVPLLLPFNRKRFKIPIYKTSGSSEVVIFSFSLLLLSYLGFVQFIQPIF